MQQQWQSISSVHVYKVNAGVDREEKRKISAAKSTPNVVHAVQKMSIIIVCLLL